MLSTNSNATYNAGMSAERFEGGCACGEIRYRMESRPMYVHCCHCYWCQRESGSAFALNAIIEADRVTLLTGKPEKVLIPSNSGKGQIFWRCSSCKIALWSNYAGAGDKIHFLRVGTLDQPERVPPDIHIYVNSKQPWVILPEGLPAMPEYYSIKEYWPQESLGRRQAAKNS